MPHPCFLNYHAINDPRHLERCHTDRVNSLTVEAFLQHLSILKAENVDLIPMPDALAGRNHERPCACLTFDDGHLADQCTTWPLLQERGIRAAFFICTLNIGGVRDPRWALLRRMHAEGHAIGAHGMGHVPFNELSNSQQRSEMERSKLVIEDRIGAPVDLFAFPSGRVTRFALSEAPAIGLSTLFTTLGPYPVTVAHPLLAHRWSIKAGTSDARLRSSVRGDAQERIRMTVCAPLRKWWFGVPMSA